MLSQELLISLEPGFSLGRAVDRNEPFYLHTPLGREQTST